MHGAGTSVFNTFYQIFFPYDWPISEYEDEAESLKAFQEKYKRRIDRFRQFRAYPGKVFFFRIFWAESDEGVDGRFIENTRRARELKEALDQYFPDLDFTLVIVSYRDLNVPEMEKMDGVIEFRIGREQSDFQTMFSALLNAL